MRAILTRESRREERVCPRREEEERGERRRGAAAEHITHPYTIHRYIRGGDGVGGEGLAAQVLYYCACLVRDGDSPLN